jgi:alcohol dehydrogenase/propanol-preferring alcohol dehydrogenase
MQVSEAGGDFELVEREIPQPGPAQVRIKVEACGICHSDVVVKEGYWPGLQYPRVPGHEVAGRIDAVGAGVTMWKPNQRVGVGWHGGHCFQCDPCRRGEFILCQFEKITGVSFDGGYADYMIAPQEAVAAIPEELPADEAAPLLCAGITVLMRCATPVRAPETWSRFKASAAWVTSAFSLHARWAFARSPLAAGKIKNLWPRSSEPASMLTPPRVRPPINCKNWAEPA